jgi:hypothetical protein
MKLKYAYIITGLLLFVIVLQLFAKESGIEGVTGSPGETTCNTSGCHSQFTLNSGPGSIAIRSTVPATGYIPNATYTVTVTVAQSGVDLFGFGFEALNTSNTNAGTLTITNSSTTRKATAFNGRENITHTFSGGQSTDSMQFIFEWKAPATSIGNVTFYAAGNAANSNGSVSGDYIYSTSKVIPEGNRITTGNVAGNPFCAGKTGITIPYTKNGIFVSGNVFTAQLSDANGSFSSPLNIGSLTSVNNGTIVSNVALPSTPGTQYRIRVVASNPATTGTPNASNLTVNLAPSTANAGNDTAVCDTMAAISANLPSIGTGTWTLASGQGNITAAGSPSTTVTGLGAGVNKLVWSIANGGCTTSRDTVIITRVDFTTIADAGTDKIACSNSTSLEGNTVVNGTGAWTLIQGAANITDPADPLSTVTALDTGDNIFVWTITNAPCSTTSDTVIIHQAGTITTSVAGPDQNLCTDNTVISANKPIVGTGTWFLVSGSGIIANPLDSVTTVSGLGIGPNVFRWSITNPPCSPSNDDIIINVSGVPTPASAGNDQTVCTDFTGLSGNMPLSGIGTWTQIRGTGTISSPSDSASTVTGLANDTNIFVWTISNPPCASTSDTVIIFRKGTITVADAGTDQDICKTSTTLTGNTAVTGTGVWTQVSGMATITDPSDPSTTVTGLGTGTHVFRWTISSAPCTPTFDEVTISNCNNHSITTDNISGSPFCSSTSYSVVVPFTSSGTFTEPFVIELSDSSGSFSNPVNIGSGSSSPLNGTIPSATPMGNNYRIRVSNATITGSESVDTLSINTCSTGLKDIAGNPEMHIYPNPNRGSFDIQFGNHLKGNVTISMFNMMGERIFSEELSGINNEEIRHFELAPGIHGMIFLLLQSETGIITKRIIVDKY